MRDISAESELYNKRVEIICSIFCQCLGEAPEQNTSSTGFMYLFGLKAFITFIMETFHLLNAYCKYPELNSDRPITFTHKKKQLKDVRS